MIIAQNKRAKFDYDILKTYEAGIVLTGQEVKSVKSGHINLKGSYVTIKNNEAYLVNTHIALYEKPPVSKVMILIVRVNYCFASKN